MLDTIRRSPAICSIAICLVLCVGAPVHAKNSNPALDKALFAAVQAQDAGAVRRLIHRGANPSAQDENEMSPLMMALYYANGPDVSMPVVQVLLNHGADVNAASTVGITAIYCAICADSLPAIKALIHRGVNLNPQQQNQERPLARAIDLGKSDIVQLLLNAGAKIDPKKGDRTYLASAANYGNIEIAKILLARGVQVNAKDSEGSTALMAAAQAGETAMVKFLVHRGATVNDKDIHGQSALLQAAMFDRVEAAKVLLASGVDPNAQDIEGSTPLSYAVIADMRDPEVSFIDLLLQHGANPNVADQGGETPLIAAAGAGEVKGVQLLLDKGANATTESFQGSALISLLKSGNHQWEEMYLFGIGGTIPESKREEVRRKALDDDATIVRALLDHGLKVTEGRNRTALIFAAGNGNLQAVQLLIAKGAQVNITESELVSHDIATGVVQADVNSDRRRQLLEMAKHLDRVSSLTPLMAAAQNGEPEVVRVLLANGATVDAQDHDGVTALMSVTANGRWQSVRMLPVYREAVLHRANEGAKKPVSPEVTPQERADWRQWAVAGDTGVVAALLAAHAEIEKRDTQGRTALMLAAVKSSPEVIETLLDAKAQVNTRDNNGETALLQVVMDGRIAHAPELFSQELEEALSFRRDLLKSPPAGPQGKTGGTANADLKKETDALQTASDKQKAGVIQNATQGDLEVLKLLIAHGADINAKDNSGQTPLAVAIKASHDVISDFLRNAGAR